MVVAPCTHALDLTVMCMLSWICLYAGVHCVSRTTSAACTYTPRHAIMDMMSPEGAQNIPIICAHNMHLNSCHCIRTASCLANCMRLV